MPDRTDMPHISEPLDEWAEKLLTAALQRHSLWCMRYGVGAEMARLKLRMAALFGFMAGSGLLGGAAGAALVKWLGA